MQFTRLYATTIYSPLILFDEGYFFCISVEAGSTMESLNEMIENDSFCGERFLKKMDDKNSLE
ncbi:hypothetical protein [Polystyrenella longa]|uniref:hypothetical protein n=1 Tax=Polystyrenella longa TaxID=2528007 RepID=UPI0011A22C25|nr:hypothetical protein [Polystyrenella longa]